MLFTLPPSSVDVGAHQHFASVCIQYLEMLFSYFLDKKKVHAAVQIIITMLANLNLIECSEVEMDLDRSPLSHGVI